MRYQIVLNGKVVSSYTSKRRAMADFRLLQEIFSRVVVDQNVVYSINCVEGDTPDA